MVTKKEKFGNYRNNFKEWLLKAKDTETLIHDFPIKELERIAPSYL